MTFTVTAAEFVAAPYNCPIDGATDCRPAFLAFKAAAQGLDSVLYLPESHIYRFHFPEEGFAGGPQTFIFSGIPSLIVDGGAGVTFSDNNTGGLAFGGLGAIFNGLPDTLGSVSARLETALAGQTFIKLKVPASHDKFAVGKAAIITAYNVQPTSQGRSSPPNHEYFEYIEPTVIDVDTGIITLAAPLIRTYLATFPNYDPGQAGLHEDQGGPATLYAPHETWQASYEFRNITFDLPANGQTYCRGRYVKFVNCVLADDGLTNFAPSVHETFTLRGAGTNWVTGFEVDKMVGTLTLDEGATCGQMYCQSPSPNFMIIDNGITHNPGTPGNLIIRNGSVISSLGLGTLGFGQTESVEISDSIVESFSIPSAYPRQTLHSSDYSNGVLTYGADPAAGGFDGFAWAAPGLKNIQGSCNSVGGFRVLDVTTDSIDGTADTSDEHTFITTSLQTSTLPTWPGGTLTAYPWPCEHMRFTNVTGCPEVENLSRPGAYDRPMNTYGYWEFDGLTLNSTISHELWGWVQSIKVNVTSAATGTLGILSRFGNYPVILGDYTQSTDGLFLPTVDLSVLGEHIIDVSTPMWFAGVATPFCESTTAQFTIEVITDPGILQGVVVNGHNSLGFKLH